MKYKKGTQEMLDAAKDDATLLPFDTVFLANDSKERISVGVKVVRSTSKFSCNDRSSVGFETLDDDFIYHMDSKDLLPAKKSKPKKWQNGTQAQLDAAKDDARLIPKKTYFLGNDGYSYSRADHINDSISSVLMVANGMVEVVNSGFFSADDLNGY